MYSHRLDPTISSPTTMVHSHYHFPTPQSLNATFASPVHAYQPSHPIEPTPLSDAPHSPDRMNAPGAPPPRNLSALCSGTQNLWGTISHRHRCHHCHYRPQPPCNLSGLRTGTRNLWGSIGCRCRHFNPVWKTVCSRPAQDPNLYWGPLKRCFPLPPCGLPPQLHQPAQPRPPPHIFQVAWHPHSILPIKSKNSKKFRKKSKKIYTISLSHLRQCNTTRTSY